VKENLKKFPPSDVIWDIDDMSKNPPWGSNISSDITDLSNYFVTSDGRDLITIIFKVFDESESEKISIEVAKI
ncbi:MAG: Imm70 family immunity protein, partial [Ruminiclostridium sp.]